MKARVAQSKCDTSGICVAECPAVFRFQQGSQKAEAITEEVTPSLEEICADIAARCSRDVIILEE